MLPAGDQLAFELLRTLFLTLGKGDSNAARIAVIVQVWLALYCPSMAELDTGRSLIPAFECLSRDCFAFRSSRSVISTKARWRSEMTENFCSGTQDSKELLFCEGSRIRGLNEHREGAFNQSIAFSCDFYFQSASTAGS